MYQLNNYKKKIEPPNAHKKKIWTQEIPTRKKCGSTKYLQRYDGTMALDLRDLRWSVTHEI